MTSPPHPAIRAASPDAPPSESSIVRKVAWRIMPLIMVCYLFAFFDRINISFAKFALQSDLGLSDTAYGFGGGLPCIVFGILVFNVLKDRIQNAAWLTSAEQTLLSSRIADQNKSGLWGPTAINLAQLRRKGAI